MKAEIGFFFALNSAAQIGQYEQAGDPKKYGRVYAGVMGCGLRY